MTLPGVDSGIAKNLDLAAMPPRADPFASFTHHQWYFHQARQTVFFAAFSSEAPDRESLIDFAANIFAHVPELGALYTALSGKLPTREAFDSIVSLEEADELDAYPDAWDMSGADLFVRHEVPMLRVRAVVRRGGPDQAGRHGVLMVLSTHALLEGADSALLSRSKKVRHDELSPPPAKQLALRQLAYRLTAAFLGPAQLLFALLIAPRRVDITYKSLVASRAKVRRVATRLGLRQRSVLFALVLFALNRGGKGFSPRKISAIFAENDARQRAGSEGAFFRHFVTEAGFRVSGDFVTFARNVEAEIDRLEKRDTRATQGLLTAVFGMHRVLRRHLPFLYSDRIFRFSGFFDINLSITPPHKLTGHLTEGMLEPIYAGSFHPGLDMCIFVPGKKYITLNFTVRRKHLAQIVAVADLLATLDHPAGP